MKKSLLALAVFTAVSGAASAQSSVTLYGKIDLGMVYDAGSASGKSVRLDSGVTGGSRIGFKGVEDLGGGTKFSFQLETGFCADSAAGATTRAEAPWPYNIVRPNIAPGTIDADALMIHGFVNQAGRFEALSIAFPPDFAQAQFVLNALNQWEFRPATQNGQNVKVEVLLIIPDVEE